MLSVAIERAVKIWLDGHPTYRCCGSCACGCDDLTRFICFEGTIHDLNEILNSHKEIWEFDY